jgi:hypothetical protein
MGEVARWPGLPLSRVAFFFHGGFDTNKNYTGNWNGNMYKLAIELDESLNILF